MKIILGNEHFTGEVVGLEFVNGVCEVAKGHETHARHIANFLNYKIVEEEAAATEEPVVVAEKPKAKRKPAVKAKEKEKEKEAK
jgi:hypothetical protein